MTACHLCGEPAKPRRCPGDGRKHSHGMIHLPNGGTSPVCDTHWRDAWELWNANLINLKDVDIEASFASFANRNDD